MDMGNTWDDWQFCREEASLCTGTAAPDRVRILVSNQYNDISFVFACVCTFTSNFLSRAVRLIT